MSLDLNFKFPMTVPANETAQQTQPSVNKPEAEQEGPSGFLELLAAVKARDEGFNQGFLAG